jgi:hypothetical protein
MLNQDNHRDADPRFQRGRFYFPHYGSICERCTISIAWISYAMKTQIRRGEEPPGPAFGGPDDKLRDEAIHSIVARRDGLLHGACHRAALCADRLACNDAVVVRQISLQA